jgi:hypothetical protein
MKNPINRGTVLTWTLLAGSIFVVGNLWIYFEDGFDWFGIIAGTIIAAFVFLMVPGRLEFIGRPKEVEVTDKGVILYQKFGRKPVIALWSEVMRVNHALIEPDKRRGHLTDSFVGVAGKKMYTIHWQIGEIIREKYKANIGCYPPNSVEERMLGK